VATVDERLGIVRADSQTKPILKHRTISEMLTIPMPSSPVLESTYNGDDSDVDESGDVTPRPHLLQTKSDTNIVRRNNTRKASPPRGPIGSGGRSPAETGGTSPTTLPEPVFSGKRHISFNTFVEQCIAVDDPAEISAIEAEAQEEEDEDDDDSDGMLEIRSASSSGRTSSSRSSRPNMSRHSSASSADHMTIAKIAPTTLKHLGGADGTPLVHVPPEAYAAEHGDDEREVVYRHQPKCDTPDYTSSGSSSAPWDEEDEYDVGVDYFNGPDLGVGDEYDTRRHMGSDSETPRAVQSNLGKYVHYGPTGTSQSPPQVGNPPNSAKWRQGTSPSSSSGSSSTGNTKPILSPKTPQTDIPGSPMGAQPSRGILKVRTPNSNPATAHIEDSSPTSSYFNFNPSPATGFGGFVQGVQRVIKETPSGSLPLYDAASPLHQSPPAGPHSVPTSPAMGVEHNERGRSAVRTPSLVDRSLSRGTTNSASVSPNAVRQPLQIPSNNRPSHIDTGNLGAKTVFTPDLSTDGMTSPGFPVSTASYAEMDTTGRGIGARATGQATAEHANMEVDPPVESYVAEKSNTPTPHSSPQVRYPFGDTTNA
jgi:hypothetical protein